MKSLKTTEKNKKEAIPPHISVCVCTFQRPLLLAQLIDKLEVLFTENLFLYSIVVVDNAADQSAKPVIETKAKTSKLNIAYHYESERSISIARNRCIKEAKGDYLAFIDDDEMPEENWLLKLYKTMLETRADGVLGPVRPYFGAEAPSWLKKSKLLERTWFKTGDVIKKSKDTRTGNVLFSNFIFKDPDARFYLRYGRSGGGDVDFFQRMMKKGRVFRWCNEAVVFEHVTTDREKRLYYISRAFTRGMTNAWKYPFFSLGTIKSLFAICVYLFVIPFCLIIGQHLFMRYFVRLCDHTGKILCYFGICIVKERPY